ncbi:MAG: diguanylate cyclase, partial [Thauera sp.]|nr:diguanylate cyclase [Thauera sp.]
DWLAAVHAYPVEAQTLWIVILAPAADFAPEWPWIALGTAAALATLLALASLIARREARRIATPLETLATLGKRIGTLDFSTPVSADTRIAEIRELGDALETMRATLARNQLAIDEQAERLKTQVEELRAAEQRIHALAYYDPLTGLPNRRLMLDRLAHALSASERRDSRGALLLL